MRIYFNSLTLPKKAAKRVQSTFNIKLSESQELVASMLGYSSWHELQQLTKNAENPCSLLDEDCSEAEQHARIEYQTDVLARQAPHILRAAQRRLALELRVSAGQRSSDKFVEDAYKQNALSYCVSPLSTAEAISEWRFFPAIRGREIEEDLWDIRDTWEAGQINWGNYLARMGKHISQQPENVSVITDFLTAAQDIGAVDDINVMKALPTFEKELERVIKDFPQKGQITIDWWRVEHRDFHRAICLLAETFYYLGRYKKAKRWFDFSARTCDQYLEHVTPFLEDLKRPLPTGLAGKNGNNEDSNFASMPSSSLH